MGKNLDGKELGRNVTQEKNGYYLARYVDKWGKRHAKRFRKLQECRKWVADQMYEDRHSDPRNLNNITVDAWYEQWLSLRKRSVKGSTAVNYDRVYQNHIKPVLGSMLLGEIKSVHCQMVLNVMSDQGYKSSSIRNTKEVMFNIFNYAYDNDAIPTNPCKKSVKHNIGKDSKPREAMTISAQKTFLEYAEEDEFRDVYVFILQTGLRIGELNGLKWQNVDLEKRTIYVRHNLEFYKELGGWIENTPKTEAGVRTIPLTEEAIQILRRQKEKQKRVKVRQLRWKDNVFLGNTGEPMRDSSYNYRLERICDKAGIPHISVHILRHTFVTRCIEAGMKPKTLQKLLGHANVSITMNLYVHTTEDEKRKEMDLVANALQMVQ